eukprot:SAG31_NODE_7167_length_1768_cov_1.581186_4_plen_78_part_01
MSALEAQASSADSSWVATVIYDLVPATPCQGAAANGGVVVVDAPHHGSVTSVAPSRSNSDICTGLSAGTTRHDIAISC